MMRARAASLVALPMALVARRGRTQGLAAMATAAFCVFPGCGGGGGSSPWVAAQVHPPSPGEFRGLRYHSFHPLPPMGPRGGGEARGNTPTTTTQRTTSSTTSTTTRTSTTRTTTASLSEVLRRLAARLDEPVPLRANPAAPSASSAAAAATAGNAADPRRLAELADELARGYPSLPPLRPIGENEKKDGETIHHDALLCERGSVLDILARECRPGEEAVLAAAEDYCGGNNNHNHNTRKSHSGRRDRLERLRGATTPSHERILDLVMKRNALSGMAFLVALREDLLTTIRSLKRRKNQRASSSFAFELGCYEDLDASFRRVLERWFAPGLLVHERITYESTPASVVEVVARTEAVHPFKGLPDLRERLSESSPKRAFGLFHPLLQGRPLAVVHCALLPGGRNGGDDDDCDDDDDDEPIHGLPVCMEDVLRGRGPASAGRPFEGSSNERGDDPGVAAFYSISNCVGGLAGVGLGEYLLKETVGALKDEFPSLEVFATLSPVPGFRKWIGVQCLLKQQQQQQQQQQQHSGDDLISHDNRRSLLECGLVSSLDPFPWGEFLDTLEQLDAADLREEADPNAKEKAKHKTRTTTTTTSTGGTLSKPQRLVLRTVLLGLLARYLALEKHRGKPLDRVCGFHVGNGAELHSIRYGADLSGAGLSKSYCLMVNYLYDPDPDRLAERQRAFESPQRTVPVGKGVRRWLEG